MQIGVTSVESRKSVGACACLLYFPNLASQFDERECVSLMSGSRPLPRVHNYGKWQ